MDETQASDLRALLKRTQVFGHLKPRELDALLREMAWFWLPGGGTLYLRGEASTSLYLLKSGSVGMFGTPLLGGAERLLGVVPAGTVIGEVSLISGEARRHSVRALRDSELLQLSSESFERLTAHHPQAMLGAARVAVQRLLRGPAAFAASPPRTFAILRAHPGVDARGFAAQLQQNLQVWGACALIDTHLGRERDTEWFAACEAQSRFVLYVDDGDARWRRLCQRQADALLLLADACNGTAAWPGLADDDAPTAKGPPDAGIELAHLRPRHLVLAHAQGRIAAGSAHAWRTRLGDGELQHHHWRHHADIGRIARLLSGHSTALVLSGGGARGFAQIGVVQALRETGIEVDSVIGTSIGAIIGAGIALQWNDEALRATCRRTMVDGKPLSDWTLPLVALTRGARTSELLREAFGEVDIEDMPVRFACVSADLTTGTTAVHREGLLWRWLRASSAVPGILPPLLHAGHVYVDGAVINNLPTDVLAEEIHGRVIAVDIGADDTLTTRAEETASPPLPVLWAERKREHWRPGAFAILVRAGMVNSETGSALRRELADLVLRPDMHQIGMFDWHQFDRAIEIGYRCTRDALRRAVAASPRNDARMR